MSNDKIQNINESLICNKLKHIIDKTKALIFGGKPTTNLQNDIIMEHNKFEIVLSFKYLGV